MRRHFRKHRKHINFRKHHVKNFHPHVEHSHRKPINWKIPGIITIIVLIIIGLSIKEIRDGLLGIIIIVAIVWLIFYFAKKKNENFKRKMKNPHFAAEMARQQAREDFKKGRRGL